MRKPLFTLLLLGIVCSQAKASTITAASCALSDVQNAVGSAKPGDTVIVPAGTACNWSGGLTIQGISLIGSGDTTSGTVVTAGLVTIAKNTTYHTRLSGFYFSGGDQHFVVNGNPYPTNVAFIIDHNYFYVSGNQILGQINSNGGLLYDNSFIASSPGTLTDVLPLHPGNTEWSNPTSFGNADTSGQENIYFENNQFTYLLVAGIDGDEGARAVYRYNTFTDSAFVFHSGYPSDSTQVPPGGVRQWEIYNNTFHRVDPNANIANGWMWARGGTGVFANNAMDSNSSSQYPDKPDINMTLDCGSLSYPVQYQIGQSAQTSAGTENPPSHPILIFGNAGSATKDANFISTGSSNTNGAGGGCSNPSTYIQVNRDYYLSNEWNWVPYTYPHPLTQSASVAAPTGLAATVQ